MIAQVNYNTWQLCIGKFNVLLKVILLFNIVKVYVDFIFTFLFDLKLWFIYERERERERLSIMYIKALCKDIAQYFVLN